MANITITVGALTSTKTIVNQTMSDMADDFVKATDGPINGTSQQKMDWCLARLCRFFREAANGNKRQALGDAAATAAGLDTRDFS